ncbi:hypothetical protein N4P33_33885 [Streptomyces sp. 15-116A]|uniref:hypothetical protein n=1 Tax=Streptomyces sp. 15-116A TaxID=2259035 RepID=UPI0021B26C09|nr:hypothetical protein [Streptomyces sp. 15-116A]MCT7357096.1 hypothetical protein [Streptomyces sp. 15-116A]
MRPLRLTLCTSALVLAALTLAASDAREEGPGTAQVVIGLALMGVGAAAAAVVRGRRLRKRRGTS